MAVITSQKISTYYDRYRDKEIIFTKDILRILRIDPRQIYIKCGGSQWPCIINSTSLMAATIILGVGGGAYAQITNKDAPPVNLRFFFFGEGTQTMSFFVAAKVAEVKPYTNSKDLALITLTFTQRPPDDLIEKLGVILEANTNAVRMKESRIVLNEENNRKLNISKTETIVYVQGVPRHCILRDLSFGGARLLLSGVPKFLEGKDITLNISFEDNGPVQVKGKIVGAENIEDRKDIIIVRIMFYENEVPLPFKMHLNEFFSNVQRKNLSAMEQMAEQRKKQLALAQAQKAAQAKANTVAAAPNTDTTAAAQGQTASTAQTAAVQATAGNSVAQPVAQTR